MTIFLLFEIAFYVASAATIAGWIAVTVREWRDR